MKLGRQTPLQHAAEQIKVWTAKLEAAEFGDPDFMLADRQLDEWYTKALDLQNLAKGAGQR
jgi:hypothetical protein